MKKSNHINFEQAIDFGEYQPEILSEFEEWKGFTSYTQLQFILKGIENRRKRLTAQIADMYNVLDFSLKPEAKEAAEQLLKLLKKVEEDKEKLTIEYSSKI